MEKYFLTQNGKPVGPWTLEEIRHHLREKSLAWTDYLFDEKKADWVLLMEHPQLAQLFATETTKGNHSTNAKLPPDEQSFQRYQDKAWFALKGESKYGPFSYLEVLKMLQAKTLHEYDYVWNLKFNQWKRVADCEEFTPEKIRGLKKSGHPQLEDVFFRRRHARADCGSSVIVHNNQSVWRARAVEISAGGCGLAVNNPDLFVGQNLFLHFKPGDGVPPFNALCQIVAKKPAKGMGEWMEYGVKFTQISRVVQLAIKDYTDRAA